MMEQCRRPALFASAVILAVAGCASPPVESGFEDVQRLTGNRIEQRIEWRRGDQPDDDLDEAIQELLRHPLSVDAAVQIALLENRSIQAAYENLGVSQAEVVQAGLLRNPVFAVSGRFADRAPRGTNLEIGVVQDFFDVLVRPARRDLARADFERVKQEVAASVVAFAGDVASAYYEALGAQQVVAVRGLVMEAAEASAELARRLHAAGNISDLQLAHEQVLHEDTRVALARAEAAAAVARERLTGLMGLWRPEHLDWTLPDRLPDLPEGEAGAAHLEALAVDQRLDLQAAAAQIEVAADSLGITVDWRRLQLLDVGLSGERDTDNQGVIGPNIALELPIFDDGEARIALREAALRQAMQEYAALATHIRSEVRALREALLAARRISEHYRSVVIPLREAQVEYTQQEFNYMLVGAFELVMAKQAEYDAYEAYAGSMRDYWVGRAGLEAAVGGRLPGDALEGVMPLGPATPPSEPEGGTPLPDPMSGHDQHTGHGG